MKDIDLQAIRARAAAARKGPWTWDGNVDTRQISLCTVHGGHVYIMNFERWGMQGATPRFQRDGRMDPAKDMVIFDVAPEATDRGDPRVYRGDFSRINHPDAEFIAHARQDIDDLLAYIAQLEDRLYELSWAERQ